MWTRVIRRLHLRLRLGVKLPNCVGAWANSQIWDGSPGMMPDILHWFGIKKTEVSSPSEQ